MLIAKLNIHQVTVNPNSDAKHYSLNNPKLEAKIIKNTNNVKAKLTAMLTADANH